MKLSHIWIITTAAAAVFGWSAVVRVSKTALAFFEIELSNAEDHVFREGWRIAMRDYALSRAHSAGQLGGTSLFSRLYRNWKARRAVSYMSHFDDYLLRDIGVAREDVIWAAGLPLTTNAALALEERSFNRRRPLSRKY